MTQTPSAPHQGLVQAPPPLAPAAGRALVAASPGIVLSPGATLAPPPSSHMHAGLDISPVTGEVRRPPVALAATACLYAGIGVLLVALGLIWWHSVDDVFHAARFIEWLRPEPSSWQALVSPVICALIGLVIGVPAGLAAHFGWNGYRPARVSAVVAAVASALTWLLTWVAMLSVPFFVVGAALLWLPTSRRYAEDQSTLRARRWAVEQHAVAHDLHYGPLPRYRD